MKICTLCSSTLHEESDKFCYKDGAPLKDADAHSCGKKIGPQDKYCPRCGVQVKK